MDIEKKRKMSGINTTSSVITLNVNGLSLDNNSIKRQIIRLDEDTRCILCMLSIGEKL